jgi:hypothetical protein
MLFKKIGGYMKSLAAIVILVALSGCSGGEFFPKGYGNQLAHKCQMDPYNYDCLNPPPAFTN